MQAADNIAFWQHGRLTSLLAGSGLRPVGDLQRATGLPDDEHLLLEKADDFGASHVFFRSRPGRPKVPEALVFDEASGKSTRPDEEFAKLHRRLWSWGAVPLVYRRLPGRVDVFRCAHQPDFSTGPGKVEYRRHDFFEIASAAADITRSLEKQPWFDFRRLANGTLWDDKETSRRFLSDASAHKALLKNVRDLDQQLDEESHMAASLRRRLLVISLLVAYLEDREVFKLQPGFFARFKPDATKFSHVLSDAGALIELLKHFETERFNGNVFKLEDPERDKLLRTPHLKKFAELIEGTTERGGQLALWRLYSFHDLPVELISHIYQLFVEDQSTCVYTPPFLARLMLEEALSFERMDRLEERDEVVFDPACGSGVFLVEAFKRLVVHWRKNHNWQRPPVDVLRKLMKRVRGTDIDGSAVELAAFSLCLAMCEELRPEEILGTPKLFPALRGDTLNTDCFTLNTGCFFEQVREQKLPPRIGVVVGNPPFVSASTKGTTERAEKEYQVKHGKLPDRQSAYLFLHHSLEALEKDGLLCLLQKDNFLYNRRSAVFRHAVFQRWDVREILDFTPIRGLFEVKDPKVVVVLAEACPPKPERPILHAIFRRTSHTQAELSFELDYYDMQWVSRQAAVTKDFVWRCNLFGGGRTIGLVERLKKLRTFKSYASEERSYSEGHKVGTPEKDEVIRHLYNQPVIDADALKPDGLVDKAQIRTQEEKYFYRPTKPKLYEPPLILFAKTDDFRVAFWDEGYLTYDSGVVGVSLQQGTRQQQRNLFERIYSKAAFYRSWIALTSATAGIQHATAINKSDIDDCPFPDNEADLDLTPNDEIILHDAFDYYRDFQRLGDEAGMMRPATPDDHREFAQVFTRQINVVHKKLRALPAKSWAGVCCQPFVFGNAQPDWRDADSLAEKLSALLRHKKSPSLTTIRILRLFDGPFVFLIKPDRLRYWLRSVALRDADEALTDLRGMGY